MSIEVPTSLNKTPFGGVFNAPYSEAQLNWTPSGLRSICQIRQNLAGRVE